WRPAISAWVSPAAKPRCSSSATPAGSRSGAAAAPPDRKAPPRVRTAAVSTAAVPATKSLVFTLRVLRVEAAVRVRIAAERRGNVREHVQVLDVVSVDAVAERQLVADQLTCDNAFGD